MFRHQGFAVGVVVMTVLLVAGTVSAGTKTLKVNCSKGQSINTALADTSPELIVEVQGVCAEYVRITRDHVTLRGIGSGATIDGASLPDPKEDGILITGATNVAIENLVVQGMRRGIIVELSAGATLSGVTLQDTRNMGLWVKGSAVTLRDLTVLRTGAHGIWIGEGAHAVVDGGTLLTRDNAGTGLVVSGANLEFGLTGGTIESSNNGLRGITFQVGAGAQLYSSAGTHVVTTGNNHAGVALYGALVSIQQLDSTGNGHGIWVEGPSSVGVTGTIAANTSYGVLCRDGGLVSLTDATVTGSGRTAISLGGECRATLTGVSVQGNSRTGMWLDGASAAISNTTISGNTGTDVVLDFGSRVSFDGDNSIVTVSCDGTELIRGDVSCSSVSMVSAVAQAADADPTAVMPEGPEVPDP